MSSLANNLQQRPCTVNWQTRIDTVERTESSYWFRWQTVVNLAERQANRHKMCSKSEGHHQSGREVMHAVIAGTIHKKHSIIKACNGTMRQYSNTEFVHLGYFFLAHFMIYLITLTSHILQFYLEHTVYNIYKYYIY